MTTRTLVLIGAIVAAVAALFLILVPTWERPPVSQEVGFRGTNMIQFTRPWEKSSLDDLPKPLPVADTRDTRTAGEVYKNVQVLQNVPAPEFMRLQYAMTQWVAPQQGCGFCHTGGDYASDSNPMKLVARRMLAMTQDINTDWKSHVGQVGVTCYTCHRGQAMPPKAWFLDTPYPRGGGIFGKPSEYKEAAHTVRDFFPNDGWEEYFLGNDPIHVESRTVTPSGDIGSWTAATRIYEMMMQMSDGIGVNCTYCHNSTNFSDWNASPPARWTAHYGFRMTQVLNQHYMWPLRTVMPQARLGPNPTQDPTFPVREMTAQDGNGLVNCTTCHVGHPKPLNGADLLVGYPELASRAAPETGRVPGRQAALNQDTLFLHRLAAETQ